MGKLLVLYDSLTQCTEKMAELVAEGARQVGGHEVRLRNVEDASAGEDVKWADGLAVGTPTNLGGISWKMKKFWDDWAAENWDKVDGKFACTFSSQGGHGGGAELACMALNIVLMNFGFVVFGVTDYVGKIYTLHYGAVVAKEPRNQTDKDACARLGLRLAEWVSVYVDNKKDLHPLLTTKKADKEKAAAAEAEKKAKAAAATTSASPSSSSSSSTSASKSADKAAAAPSKLSTSKYLPPLPPPKSTHLVVTIAVPPRNFTAFLALIKEMEQNTQKEPGCLRYEFTRVDDGNPDPNPVEVVVVEEYVDDAALDAHSNSEYFQRIVPALGKVSQTTSVKKSYAIAPQPDKVRTYGAGPASLAVMRRPLLSLALTVGVAFGLGIALADKVAALTSSAGTSLKKEANN